MEPTAVIFARPSFLVDKLRDQLTKRGCKVFLVERQTDQLPQGAHYCFLIGEEATKNKKALDFIKLTQAKAVSLLPYEGSSVIDLPDINAIYVGQIYGVGMDVNKKDLVSRVFGQVMTGKIDVPSYDFTIFPIHIDLVVDYVIRGIFGYGFPKKRFVLADKISVYDFIRKVQKVAPWVVFERNGVAKKPVTAPVFDFVSLGITDETIAETINWLKTVPQKSLIKKPVVNQRRPVRVAQKRGIRFKKPKVPRKRTLAIFLVIFLWVLFLPFFSLFASLITFERAYRSFVSADRPTAQRLLSVSGIFATFARAELGIFRRIPILGDRISFIFNASSILQEATVLGKSGFSIYSDLGSVLGGIMSGDDYNLSQLSDKIFLGLDTIYKDSSFLEGEIHDIGPLVTNTFPQIKNFSTLRRYVLAASNLAQKLPLLLGNDKKVTYMILFQNNMELRPTGGFIGSFALVTFDHGKLVDTSIHDVYEADGQLKGHIEPPGPIKNYLGEANWFLRDSNWDPDFSVSAQRAEWFLGKEFDREVDGVVALDLEVVKELLTETGPVNLSDVNMVIDAKNMYEKIQHEVESNFFPGSQKKSTILTSLENALLAKLPDLIAKPKLGVTLLSLLRGKHIQIFLHDKDAQDAISSVDFDGRVDPNPCSGNCANVWFGMVEANLGVNKVNYYVDRSAKMIVNVKPTNIESQLTVKITNTSTADSPLAGNYKNYMRILTPSKSYFDKVTITGKDGTKTVQPDTNQVRGHVEGGTLITVSPGETKTIVFAWNTAQTTDFTKNGEIDFSMRKQAGVETMPLVLKMNLPLGKKYAIDSNFGFTLTASNEISYNTDLTTDISGRVFWK